MNFEFMQGIQDAFLAYFAAYPVLVGLGYFVVFALVTALCLPGAAALMLLGGASFGLAWGSVLATLASTTGASLTMLAARHLMRERVETRWASRLLTLNQGLQRHGLLYLLSLRLLPVVPFVPLNLASGLTRLPFWRFFWVSALGMLPGTALYVYAGTHVHRLAELPDWWAASGLAAWFH